MPNFKIPNTNRNIEITSNIPILDYLVSRWHKPFIIKSLSDFFSSSDAHGLPLDYSSEFNADPVIARAARRESFSFEKGEIRFGPLEYDLKGSLAGSPFEIDIRLMDLRTKAAIKIGEFEAEYSSPALNESVMDKRLDHIRLTAVLPNAIILPREYKFAVDKKEQLEALIREAVMENQIWDRLGLTPIESFSIGLDYSRESEPSSTFSNAQKHGIMQVIGIPSDENLKVLGRKELLSTKELSLSSRILSYQDYKGYQIVTKRAAEVLSLPDAQDYLIFANRQIEGKKSSMIAYSGSNPDTLLHNPAVAQGYKAISDGIVYIPFAISCAESQAGEKYEVIQRALMAAGMREYKAEHRAYYDNEANKYYGVIILSKRQEVLRTKQPIEESLSKFLEYLPKIKAEKINDMAAVNLLVS